MRFEYYNWEAANINWDALDMNWEEVGILINDVLHNVSAPIGGGKKIWDDKKINELPAEKRRKIIKMACDIEGSEYIAYKYAKDDDAIVTIDHIDIIIDKIINNIKVHVQNIS
jgi:hypothetical protein